MVYQKYKILLHFCNYQLELWMNKMLFLQKNLEIISKENRSLQ